jgi:hypothetical protein
LYRKNKNTKEQSMFLIADCRIRFWSWWFTGELEALTKYWSSSETYYTSAVTFFFFFVTLYYYNNLSTHKVHINYIVSADSSEYVKRRRGPKQTYAYTFNNNIINTTMYAVYHVNRSCRCRSPHTSNKNYNRSSRKAWKLRYENITPGIAYEWVCSIYT